jgi:hypothetical protein
VLFAVAALAATLCLGLGPTGLPVRGGKCFYNGGSFGLAGS